MYFLVMEKKSVGYCSLPRTEKIGESIGECTDIVQFILYNSVIYITYYSRLHITFTAY